MARGFNEVGLATPVQCSTNPSGLNGFVVYDDLTYPLPSTSSAGAGEAAVLRWTHNDLWAVIVAVDTILLVLLLMMTFLVD